MKRFVHKKIYYIPGIISLIILPFVFCFFAKQKIQHLPHVIHLNLPDTLEWKKYPSRYRYVNIPRRNYLDIVLTGNQQNDNIKLQFAQIRIREILKENDTLNGVHFLFQDNATYGTFIGALDKLQIEDADRYWLIGNSIWFWDVAHVESLPYDCLLCNDVVYIQPEIPLWKKIKAKVILAWNNSYQIILLYCCFAGFVLVKRFRRYQ